MPGRYSHSVVLADYSSRGIISLPPDQVSRYLESSPLPEKRSVSQLRIRGTRSAQAIYHEASSKASGRTTQPDHRHVAVSQPQHHSNHHLDVNVNHNIKEFSPMRYSRYYDQTPKSTPMTNLTGQSSQPEMRTAYQRQQDVDRNVGCMPSSGVPAIASKQPQSEFAGAAHGLGNREKTPRADIRKETNTVNRLLSSQALPAGASLGRHHAATSPTSNHKNVPFDTQGQASANHQKHTYSDFATSSSREQKGSGSAKSDNRSYQSKAGRVSPDHVSGNDMPAGSDLAQNTPSFQPKPNPPRDSGPVLLEPDFDGFLDASASLSESSFDWRGGPTDYSRSSSHHSTILIQRPRSSDRRPSQGQQSSGAETVSTRPTAAQNDVLSSPSQTTQSSVKTSTRAHRSNSSASSVSVSNSHISAGVSKQILEGSRRNSQTPKPDQSWRLPEISEDKGFSPSIFEDRDGGQIELRSGLGMRLEDFDADLVIGQISSGKDVTFDNSDAMSELSAALPPPITRFRDEEDEFNTNMAKFFGDGGDYTASKKAGHSVGRSAGKKTKDFFSKFRSKGSTPHK